VIILGLWFLLIFILSVIPVSGPETGMPEDKFAHLIMYGLTSMLLFRYLAGKESTKRAFYISVALSALYGAVMEAVQHFLPHRSFSFLDMTANILGAFLGALLYMKIVGRKKRI
jgi:VanZ family protein